MARKEKIILQYGPDMEAINTELAAAMDALDASVQRVDAVLREMAPIQQQLAEQQSAEQQTTANSPTNPTPENEAPTQLNAPE